MWMVLAGLACAQRMAAGQITSIDSARTIVDYRQTPTGLSLPDSPAAADLIKRAVFEESQAHWENAADLYQQALAQFPNRVIEIKSSSDSGLSRYVGTSQIVQSRLEKWPQEARDIYKGLYEQTADDLLRTAPPHQTRTLLNVFWNYGASDAGKQAGIALVDLYLESGDFRAACSIGEQLVRLLPSTDPDRAMILFRVALAEHDCGDDTACRAMLDQLIQDFPDAVGGIGGKSVRLVDALQQACATASVEAGQSADLLTEMPANNSSKTAALSASLTGLHRIAKFPFTSSAGPTSPTVIPVLDGSALFFQDGRGLYAVDLQTGNPLSSWSQTYSGKAAGHYDCQVAGPPGNELHTMTVSGSMILAVMGQSTSLAATASRSEPTPAAASTAKLVCLDRTTGRQLWTRAASQLPASNSTLNKAEFDGTPLLIPAMFTDGNDPEGSVIVTARTGRFYQFDECYVVCLSARTGEYRWSTYLGGATHDAKTLADPAQMTFAQGQLCVMTNLGVIASINPADGRITWLNAYPHDTAQAGRNIFERSSPQTDRGGAAGGLPAWSVNPVLVDHDQLYVLPNDSKQLFILNDQTGDVKRAIPTESFDNANLLLGADKETLYLGSQRKVFALDWRKLDSQNSRSANASNGINWTADLSFGDDSRIAGRGFVTGDSVLVPTTNRIVQIKNGRIRSTYPSHGSFLADEGPGNILATNSLMIVAGQRQTDIYSGSIPVVRDQGHRSVAN
jgi:outer membrane protein assembly factor BamB